MVHMLNNDDVIRNSFSEGAFVAQPGHKSEDFFCKSGFIQNLQRMLGSCVHTLPFAYGSSGALLRSSRGFKNDTCLHKWFLLLLRISATNEALKNVHHIVLPRLEHLHGMNLIAVTVYIALLRSESCSHAQLFIKGLSKPVLQGT